MKTRKKTLSSLAAADASEAFQRHLAKALDQFHHPEWLGDQSPLSAPYFLGGPGVALSALQRGQALQRLLRQAADWLASQGEETQDSIRLLNETFFQPTPRSVDEIIRRLHVSRANYFRKREQAIRQLSVAFIRQTNPALRFDRPARPARMMGRDALRDHCVTALEHGRTIGLSGPAGVGKTTLGAAVADRLTTRQVFWYTFVHGLNDHLGSLLFALGFFLWNRGAASLWGQLIADQGRINPTILAGLLRSDLAALQDVRLVLCFDEVDLLRPDEVESHAQVAGLIASLRDLCACLFIGQRPLLEVDEQVVVDGLDSSVVQHYLSSAGILLTVDDLRQLVDHTAGNPRLLDLFVSLHHAGEPITDLLQRLQTAPSIEFLWNRIRTHLDPDEQRVLDELAVFRRPAPADVWPPDTVAQLMDRRLVTHDARGGVALLPALRAVVYGQMRSEERRLAHLGAAVVRAARAEYTAAACHYVHADQARIAVWLWHAHRAEEINQGQGATALVLFEQIDDSQLDGPDRDIHALNLAELRKLAGLDPRPDLKRVAWQSSALKALAQRIEGDLAEQSGQMDEAIAAYQDGLTTVESLLAEKALFDKNLGWAYMRKGGASLEMAWQKASLARYEAERLQGDIQSRMGNFALAEHHFTQALSLAQSFQHVEGLAKTHNHLATLLTRQNRLDEAREHRRQAITLFQQLGNQLHLAGARLNLAFDLNLAGQQQAVAPPADATLASLFDQAIQTASEALDVFERLNQPLGKAIAEQNLAEAHLYLDHLPQAEVFAHRVTESTVSSVVPDGLRTLGEVRLAMGDPAPAESLVRQSIELAKQNGDRYLEAYGWRALARVLCADNRDGDGQTAINEAIQLFESIDLSQEVERCRAVWARMIM